MDERISTGRAEPKAHSYETRDAQLRPLLVFGAVLTLGTILVLFSMAWLINFFEAQHTMTDPPPSPVAIAADIPVGPLLEVQPARSLEELRHREAEILESYGWVDRNLDLVRIPIDRAIELLADRGLPHRSDPASPGEATRSDEGERSQAVITIE